MFQPIRRALTAMRYGDYYPGPLTVSPASGALFGTNAIQTGGPVTTVFSAAGQSLTLSMPGAASYLIWLTPVSGQGPLIGTITSTDSVTGGNRLIFKTGVGELDVSTINLTGTQGALVEYRTIGGGNGQTITLTGYTSGQANVSILGVFNTVMVFPNGPIHSAEEAALRNGKAFSGSTGVQAVTAGQYESLLLANPAGSNVRAIITNRLVTADSPTGQIPCKWYSLANPTVNAPTTAATPTNRKTGGSASMLTLTYTASGASIPDTSPTTPVTSRVGGMVPTGGSSGGPMAAMRTLEPGQSTSLSILAVSNGSGIGSTNPNCSIDFTWYEESIN